MKKETKLLNLALSAMFLALAYVMPFLTGQIPQIGAMLCPMHIPVILCGFACGWPWGMLVGLTAPLLRSLTLGVPPLFPKAVAMAFELLAYGFVSGFMYSILPKKKGYIYCSLIVAMAVGRLVWGAVQFLCAGLDASEFSFEAFWAGAVTNALPGIVLQLLLIPMLVMLLESAKLTSKKL